MKNKMKMNRFILALLVLPLFFGCGDNNETPIENIEHILDLPPMKDHFKDKFLIGNIMNSYGNYYSDISEGKISNPNLTRHFNVLTCENQMKPSYLISGHNNGEFTWNTNNQTTANNMVDAAIASDFKVIGHTLLWHSQNADWMWEQIASKIGTKVAGMTKEKATEIMKGYITAVAGYYKGKIHSWDVLNEAFPDNVSGSADWKNAMRKGASGEWGDANPWYIAIGSDFVYEGFLAARLADPDAILYYNDYNTDMTSKATVIRNMVLEVNNKYLSSGDKPAGEDPNRLLIEGIGIQEHHNTNVSASAVKATLNMFKNMSFTGSSKKIIISVSELDVLSQTWSDYDSKTPVTNAGRAAQATKYGEYMKVYLEFSDIIERVSLWGVTDNRSWRSTGEPLLFDKDGMAKPAYYSFVGALP